MKPRASPLPGLAALLLSLTSACTTPIEVDWSCFERIQEMASLELVFAEVVDLDQGLARLRTDNHERERALYDLMSAAGCGSELRLQAVPESDQHNVICRLPGQTTSTIVVGAHFDKVANGDGAIDNWTGASLLPLLYLSASSRSRVHTYEFVGFAAEEGGLLGSAHYVARLQQGPLQVRAMLNLDTLGAGRTKVEANRADPELLCHAHVAAELMSAELRWVNVSKVGMTDSESFREAGIPTLSLHSVDQQNLKLVHSDEDRLDRVDRAHLYETYRVAGTFLALLDTAPKGD